MSAVIGVAVYARQYQLGELHLATNNSNVAYFSLFMAMWGTCFLEFWKRYNAELAYRWSTTALAVESKERSEFISGCLDDKRLGFYASNGKFVPYDEDLEPDNSNLCTRICNCGLSFRDDTHEV